MASARSVSLNRGLGTEPQAGSRGTAEPLVGQSPGGGSEGRPEAENFLSIFIQKGPKS